MLLFYSFDRLQEEWGLFSWDMNENIKIRVTSLMISKLSSSARPTLIFVNENV